MLPLAQEYAISPAFIAIIFIVLLLSFVAKRRSTPKSPMDQRVVEFCPGKTKPPAVYGAINFFGRMLLKLGVKSANLDEGALIDEAIRQTNCTDFGDPSWRDRFSLVMQALQASRLTFIGRCAAHSNILRLLTQRLMIIDHFKRYAKQLETAVLDRPVFIVGLHRTGTTLLFHLLFQDDRFRSLPLWQMAEPFVLPTAKADDRRERVRKNVKSLEKLVPGINAVHEIDADRPEECIAITAFDFQSVNFEIFGIPLDYCNKIFYADYHRTYEFYYRFLLLQQLLQDANTSADSSRKRFWLRKAPDHLMHFKTLFKVFPNALVIWNHRDPAKSLVSIASLRSFMRSAWTEHIDHRAEGQYWAYRSAEMLEHAMNAREQLPLEQQQNILDVHYDELAADPLTTVRKIYQRLGLTLEVDVEEKMKEYLAAHKKGSAGIHKYSAATFGIDEAALVDRLKPYYTKYQVPRETAV